VLGRKRMLRGLLVAAVAGSVTSERKGGRFRKQRFDGEEHGVHHFGLECAHDVR
jgi:hypothetical protein